MTTKIVCQLDFNGLFIGLTDADESPLELGVFLLPAGAVDAPAPELIEGFDFKWEGSKFLKIAKSQVINPPPPPPPSVADLKLQALALARSQRAPIINVLDGMQASALTAADLTKAQAIQTAKQGLKDLTKIDLSACQTADDFKRVIMDRYRQIAAALPVDVRIAFAEALQ